MTAVHQGDLQLQLERYRLAFDVSPTPLLLVAPDGRIALTNDGFDALFGYENGELAGKPVELLVPAAVRQHHPTLREAYARLPTKRQMGSGRDLFGVTRDGRQIPLEIGLDSVMIGKETWVLVSALDITERQASERRMSDALNAAASAMVMVNREGMIVLVNRAACNVFGYERERLVGEPVECLLPNALGRAHAVYRQSYFARREPRAMGQGRPLAARRADGSEVMVEIGLTPIDGPDGQFVMATIVDVSERLDHERSLAAQNEELSRLNGELTQFAYSASHDLKAPLATMSGLLEIALEDLAAGELEDCRSNIADALATSQRNAHRIEAVLEIARAGREERALEEVALEPLIHEVWHELTASDKAAPQLALELQPELALCTERQTLEAILENLLANACTFTDPAKGEARVRLKASTTGRAVLI